MAGISIEVPNGRSGDWTVSTFAVDERVAAFRNRRSRLQTRPGTYKQLLGLGHQWMTNLPEEVEQHRAVIERATGNVLVMGLGLGLVVKAILEKSEVGSITVLEKSSDVIQLVAASYRDARVTIIQADAFKWLPPYGARFDVVWHDIWPTVLAENMEEIEALKKRYAPYADWQGAWCEQEAQCA